MIKGVGIDTVTYKKIEDLIDSITEEKFFTLFSDHEIVESESAQNETEYLATRFAVKNAFYKAVSNEIEISRAMTYKNIETRNKLSGEPYIAVHQDVEKLLEEAGINRLHVSTTVGSEVATAIVLAEG